MIPEIAGKGKERMQNGLRNFLAGTEAGSMTGTPCLHGSAVIVYYGEMKFQRNGVIQW